MKKTLVSALTTALVVGAASTTFAAANPFADVPADHWAYDAVTTLAADGVITGYPDGTFQGDNNITRYEMAQMIAKGLANQGSASAADKAMLDKLAAEFGDELANLGVRVANLEKKVDNVKWSGFARYEYKHVYNENKGGHQYSNDNKLRLRLNMTAQVNDQWVVGGRIEVNGLDADAGKDSTGDNVKVQNIFAKTTVGKTQITAGRFDEKDPVTHGMLFDGQITGAQVIATGKTGLTLKLDAGRMKNDQYTWSDSDAATYMAAAVYKNGSKWDLGTAFHSWNAAGQKFLENKTDEVNNVWAFGAKYKFSKKFDVDVDYARSMSSLKDHGNVDFDKNAYALKLNYMPTNKVSAYVGYANLPIFSDMSRTYNFKVANVGMKGWALGFKWTLQKNVNWYADYFMGTQTESNTSTNISNDKLDVFFTRLEFVF